VRFAISLWLAAFPALAASPVTDIKVDQVGYLTSAPKVAFSTRPATEFTVRRTSDQKIVFKGTAQAAMADADSGDAVQALDFSHVKAPGKYYVDVPGVGRSWDFEIGPKVYERAYYLAMRSYYGQRCGTAVDLGSEFPGYKYAACHLVGAYHESSGRSGEDKYAGGWHDAGDYGRYIVNSGITTGTLLWTWEMFGSRIRGVGLNIPESGRKLPDLLSEIKWNLDWMMSMQDADGGLWQKQTSERFCAFIMPEDDKLVSYVIGTGAAPYKSSCATADFAAVMAIAARVYRPFDTAYADKCLQAAKLAWNWVEKNPNVLFRNPKGVSTGAYGDGNCSDELLWAAAELNRATGEEPYRRYFLDHYQSQLGTLRAENPQSWSDVAPLALWTYVLGKGKDEAALTAIKTAAIAAADQIVERKAKNGYRISLVAKDYIWGSNGVIANYAMQLIVANAFKPDRRYVDAALDDLHYMLGRNAFSLSFVTQVGENPYRHPHHRPSGADKNPEPWPGLLSGGPNANRQDDVTKKLPPLPPAKVYADEQDSYASNEIAINWNAPLIYVLVGALAERP
jgi:endoglucanase